MLGYHLGWMQCRDRYSNRRESLRKVALMMTGTDGGPEWREAVIPIDGSCDTLVLM